MKRTVQDILNSDEDVEPVDILSNTVFDDLDIALITATLSGFKYIAVDKEYKLLYAYKNRPVGNVLAKTWVFRSNESHVFTGDNAVILGFYSGDIPWHDTLRGPDVSHDKTAN